MTGDIKPLSGGSDSAVSKKKPRRKAAQDAKPFTTCVRLLAFCFLKLFFRLKVSGLHNLPDAGGALIACNHQSYLDPIMIGATSRRPVVFMARDTLFRNRLFAWLIRKCNTFPVRRGALDRKALQTAVEKLRAGRLLLLFPEGRRTDDGSIKELHSGAMVLAHKGNVPIVPAVVNGTFEAWPRTRRLFRCKPVSITYGEPMPPPDAATRESYERVSLQLQHRLKQMLEEEKDEEEKYKG